MDPLSALSIQGCQSPAPTWNMGIDFFGSDDLTGDLEFMKSHEFRVFNFQDLKVQNLDVGAKKS